MRTTLLVMLVLAVLAASGCRRGRATIAPTVPRALASMAHQALGDIHCDHVDQVLLVLPGVIQVRGCGERREYVVAQGRGAPALEIAPIEPRAALELQCAEGSLRVDSPAPAVRGVLGCGRRARYDLLCRARHCEWTMTAHAGAWAGLESSVPQALPTSWSAPASAAAEDLSGIVLPPPPDASIPPPPEAEPAPAPTIPPPASR